MWKLRSFKSSTTLLWWDQQSSSGRAGFCLMRVLYIVSWLYWLFQIYSLIIIHLLIQIYPIIQPLVWIIFSPNLFSFTSFRNQYHLFCSIILCLNRFFFAFVVLKFLFILQIDWWEHVDWSNSSKNHVALILFSKILCHLHSFV